MAAFKTNTASKCVLMFSKNSYLFHVNMKLFLAIVNMSNWSQKEIFITHSLTNPSALLPTQKVKHHQKNLLQILISTGNQHKIQNLA